MVHNILFLALPPLGLLAYVVLVRRMIAARLPSPPSVPLFFVFAAYGAVVLFFISEMARVWSGMHSLALGALLVGSPLLIAQGVLWRKTWSISRYHRATIALSFAFPVALAGLFAFAAAR